MTQAGSFALTVLRECPLFAQISDDALAVLAERATVVELAGGQVLMECGAPAEEVYIVATGRLHAVLADGSVIGSIGRLEPVGEIGTLAHEARVVSVHATRDSVLIRIPGAHLNAVIRTYPDALTAFMRVIVRRLRGNASVQRLEKLRARNSFAVVSALPSADAATAARHLVTALHGPARLLDARDIDCELGAGIAQTSRDAGAAHRRLVEHLNTIEASGVRMVYVSGRQPDAWARRCMRQADRILLVVDAHSPPQDSAMLEEWRRSGARAPLDLVFCCNGEATPAADVLGWRSLSGAVNHYHVDVARPHSFASLARQVTGHGVGLVLGGGGARGFAHIGLLRALEELRIPVDALGGSSMGAFIGALTAAGCDSGELLRIARETFVTHNHLNDYLFPSVALIRGRRFLSQLRTLFGEQCIEHLPRPYFCLSANLTRGQSMVHDQGPAYLWVAASMAVPGVVPPIVYRGELLADGGVLNNLPADIMQAQERGLTIASDVSPGGGLSLPGVEGPDPEALLRAKDEDRPRLFSIIFRTATLTSESGTAQRAALADVYLRMPVQGIGMFDWKRLDELVQRGYEHAMTQLAPQSAQLRGAALSANAAADAATAISAATL